MLLNWCFQVASCEIISRKHNLPHKTSNKCDGQFCTWTHQPVVGRLPGRFRSLIIDIHRAIPNYADYSTAANKTCTYKRASSSRPKNPKRLASSDTLTNLAKTTRSARYHVSPRRNDFYSRFNQLNVNAATTACRHIVSMKPKLCLPACDLGDWPGAWF